MIHLIRTDSSHEDFHRLVAMLDEDLKIRDGDDHSFYAQFNSLKAIRHVVVAYLEDEAVGCGAFKEYSHEKAEIKRMFVHPLFRGRQIASRILTELETWAMQTGYSYAMLETGKKQPEAIGLYMKAGYHMIPNYSQYAAMENSVCMEKKLVSRKDTRNGD